ncbi:MAG: pseudaminic acid synthase [Candidatus Taylorbacteria bacterium]|nr:pseudaminic acid synthase [Candidatus Taylorbacteria bacterium]
MAKPKTLKIGKRQVGEGQPAFIVAEMSGNHEQNFDKAVSLIKAAKDSGADAIKIQTYTPDTMTIDSDLKWFRVGGEKNPQSWKGQTVYELYKKAFTPWEWVPKLRKIADDIGLIFFSTPFDATAVDYLEGLNMPCYKIAAYESIDVALLKRVAKTKKPVIVSAGFSSLDEVELMVKTLKKAGAKDLVVLQCTTSYASEARVAATNLLTMSDIKDRFGVLSGLSDNMGGIKAPILAASLGASVIEKHLVLRHDKALDDRFSLDPDEFRSMTSAIRENEQMLGIVSYGPQTEEEKYNRNFRRSLFAVADIKKGEKFTALNIRSIRPGYGLPPYELDKIVGRKAKRDIKRGTPLKWDLID